MKYREIGDVPYDVWVKELERVGSPLLPYSQAMYDVLRGHTALALAQMWQEAQYETDRDLLTFTDYNPFNMKEWPEDPRGMWGIGAIGTKPTGVGGPDYLTFESPIRAAQEWRRRVIDDPDYKSGVYKPDMTLEQYIETFAPSYEEHPTTGEDNSSYPKNVVTMLKRYGVWKEEKPVATTFKKHQFPGLPNPVYLPSSIPVEIKIIPNGVAGWTSGQKIPASNFTSSTYHDTGNPNTNANAEYAWARGGGREDAPGSYNGIFDGSKIIITQRFDELVGHAANHTGNVTSYAFEEAYGGAGNSHDKALEVGMWLHAGVLQAMGKLADTSMYQHNYWKNTYSGTHKDCPRQIRSRNQWPYVEKTVDQRIAEIVGFIAGDVIDPKPPVTVYPKPSPVPVLDAVSSIDGVAPSFVVIPGEGITAFFVGDRYEAIKNTPRNQYAYTGSPVLNVPIKQGETLDVDFVFENQDGKWGYTPYGTRVNLADLKRVSDQKGESE